MDCPPLDDYGVVEGTQQVMYEATQQECTLFASYGGESRSPRSNVKRDEVDIWGLLRQLGGQQMEYRLKHRVDSRGRRDTYIIGRGKNSDIVVQDKLVSSSHCIIYCDYSQARLRVMVEDCSANGTFINDSLTRLKRGDRVGLKSGDELILIYPKVDLSLCANGHSMTSDAQIKAASFIFVNMRERMAMQRSIDHAPVAGSMTVRDDHQRTNTRHIEDHFVVGDQIGSGMCGTVHLCVERATQTHYAVKIIDTKKFALNPGLSPVDIREEAVMMRKLNHPNIIGIKDAFEHDKIIYIVMELVKGGDLFDRIVEKGKYTEQQARQVMHNVMSAVQYLHSMEIIHRDLKPENILLVDANDDTNVKITDFGLAKRTNQEGLKTFCGTPQYFAPEVLQRKSTIAGVGSYGTSADMWSLGVVLYILLSGTFPFDEDNLLSQVEHGRYDLTGPEWTTISESAKDLVKRLMTLHPLDRIDVKQALAHPWLEGHATMDAGIGATTTKVGPTVNTTADNRDIAGSPVPMSNVGAQRENDDASAPKGMTPLNKKVAGGKSSPAAGLWASPSVEQLQSGSKESNISSRNIKQSKLSSFRGAINGTKSIASANKKRGSASPIKRFLHSQEAQAHKTGHVVTSDITSPGTATIQKKGRPRSGSGDITSFYGARSSARSTPSKSSQDKSKGVERFGTNVKSPPSSVSQASKKRKQHVVTTQVPTQSLESFWGYKDAAAAPSPPEMTGDAVATTAVNTDKSHREHREVSGRENSWESQHSTVTPLASFNAPTAHPTELTANENVVPEPSILLASTVGKGTTPLVQRKDRKDLRVVSDIQDKVRKKVPTKERLREAQTSLAQIFKKPGIH